MHNSLDNLISIEKELKLKVTDLIKPQIIAVSKTFPLEKIMPLIKHGHNHFGENKVQEAVKKWTDIKRKNSNLILHMIGKLQSNKVKYAIDIFDYIHSLDNIKLAEKISIEEKKRKKRLKIFIQINIGNEVQKSGINVDEISDFYDECVKKFDLNIIGLMCLPPNKKKNQSYFSEMKTLKDKIKLKDLSMGMSNDYFEAINYGATYLRIGSKIFGERN